MTDDLRYEEVERLTRDQVIEAFKSTDNARIAEALYSATYYDRDWRWVQEQCLHYLNFSDLWVRRNAATCLGILAVFHKQLDVERVIPKLEEAGRDEALRAYVEDSLRDIRHNIYRE